ncbi:MAG: FMN-binding negative transcriptional regulator [Alphaproteobacteria bacterium]|nr:FMN-binding negative transcriptional regulator [Alphaproteobacteria bacterium]
MYVPAPFAFPPHQSGALFDVIETHPFALMTVAAGGTLDAVHAPLLIDRRRGVYGTLRGHVARANPIWQTFGGGDALVVFHGPHAYVSPDWYATPGLVPTWNYVAVHAHGIPEVIDEPDCVLALLADLSAAAEASLAPKPSWTLDKVPAASRDALLGGIVAFEIVVTRLEGKQKLSQNRRPADIAGVEAALRAQGDEANRAVADLMAAAKA